MDIVSRVLFVWLVAALLTIALGLQGCSSGTGWKFEVGIVPVNGVSDTKTLKGSDYKQAEQGRKY